jgi:hypothetical protein
MNDGELTTKVNRSNRKGDMRFNMKNLPNSKGKNHGCQQANLHYVRSQVTMPNDGLQEMRE